MARTRRRRTLTTVLSCAVTAVVAVGAVPASAAEHGQSSAPAAAGGGDAGACDDPLTRVAPDGVVGDERAVSITAQALDADQPGWAFVQWQTDPRVEVATLEVVRRDGTRDEGPASGFAEDVVELVLCGHRVPDPAPDPPEDAAAGPEDAEDAEDAEGTAHTGDAADAADAGDAGAFALPRGRGPLTAALLGTALLSTVGSLLLDALRRRLQRRVTGLCR